VNGPDGRCRRWGWFLGLGVIATAILVGGVFVYLPVGHSFAFEMPPGRSCGASFANATYADGAQVAGSWETVSSAFPADVEILGNGGTATGSNLSGRVVVYAASGMNGSFAFPGNGGAYVYEVLPATQEHVGCAVPPAVSIQGSWTATLYQTYASLGPPG
jgi:hypothetical protein